MNILTPTEAAEGNFIPCTPETLARNIEERLWAVPTGSAQHCLAWRMLDEHDGNESSAFGQGNYRCYVDMILGITEEQF